MSPWSKWFNLRLKPTPPLAAYHNVQRFFACIALSYGLSSDWATPQGDRFEEPGLCLVLMSKLFGNNGCVRGHILLNVWS